MAKFSIDNYVLNELNELPKYLAVITEKGIKTSARFNLSSNLKRLKPQDILVVDKAGAEKISREGLNQDLSGIHVYASGINCRGCKYPVSEGAKIKVEKDKKIYHDNGVCHYSISRELKDKAKVWLPILTLLSGSVYSLNKEPNSFDVSEKIAVHTNSNRLWTRKPNTLKFRNIEFTHTSQELDIVEGPKIITRGKEKFNVASIKKADLVGIAAGDSVTEAVLINDGKSYPELLENKLRIKYPGKEVYLLNAGVAAYGAYQISDVVTQLSASVHPDFVLIQYCSFNDFNSSIAPVGTLLSNIDKRESILWKLIKDYDTDKELIPIHDKGLRGNTDRLLVLPKFDINYLRDSKYLDPNQNNLRNQLVDFYEDMESAVRNARNFGVRSVYFTLSPNSFELKKDFKNRLVLPRIFTGFVNQIKENYPEVNIAYVDLYNSVLNPNQTLDGIHFDESGLEAIASKFMKDLEKNPPKRNKFRKSPYLSSK
jgi:lysophospholipase L1-like esterase